MKKFFEKFIALAFGAKIHANHTAIKGHKSGGQRDSFGNDFHKFGQENQESQA